MDFAAIITAIGDFVWGPPLLVLLLGSHLFLTFRTGFIQRKIFTAIKLSVTKDPDAEGDVSQFGALATALSATIGTGNIIGVATAISVGGPGAVLWMWLTGVFGIATKYAETYISVKYRVKDHKGEMLGGAMFAWRRAFEKDGKAPMWALFGAGAFALLAAIASFGIGSAVQANSVTGVIVENFPMIPRWVVGVVIVVLTALVLVGGVKSITRVCEKLVPFMAVFVFLGCIIILCMRAEYIGQALSLIFTTAFQPVTMAGGVVGYGVMRALQFGAARGLFSNESGMGSAPIVAAAATTRNPARQALVSMTGTFWDTVVLCGLIGITFTTTLCAYPELLVNGSFETGAALASKAFGSIPVIGTPILVVGLALFAYSTILGWSYYGNRCIAYLFGKKAILPYQVLYIAVAFFGAVGIGDLVWNISDITNALMVVPNIIIVLMLSGMIARETKYYVYDGNLDEVSTDEIPVFDSK